MKEKTKKKNKHEARTSVEETRMLEFRNMTK